MYRRHKEIIRGVRSDKMTEKQKELGKEGKEQPDTDKPSMFLRRGAKGGLYFFSPKNTVIYYLSGKHVKELLDGKRDFAVIHKGGKKAGQ